MFFSLRKTRETEKNKREKKQGRQERRREGKTSGEKHQNVILSRKDQTSNPNQKFNPHEWREKEKSRQFEEGEREETETI